MVEVAKMKLEVQRNPDKFDYYTKEDEAHFVELIREDGAFSLFLYSKNVLTKDGMLALDGDDEKVRVVARSGKMYVPVSFFIRFLGVNAETVGASGYLPLKETCEKLGIAVRMYNDGLLAVVGGSRIYGEIELNPRLVYAGGYATLGNYDPRKFTAEDYAQARKKVA